MKTAKPRRTPKYIVSLKELIERGEAGLNELEALSAYGETALHSTISTLCNGHGLEFKRVFEPHRHRRGGITHFMRYTLIDRDKALSMVQPYHEGDR